MAPPDELWNGEEGAELDQEPAPRYLDQRQVLDTSGNESIQEGTVRDEVVAPVSTTCGFVKLTRNPDVLELIKASPFAFVLATVIAIRARWKRGYNAHSLDVGEAFLGDFKECGLTRQQYRTATRRLREARFATFKSTNRGTVARLLDSRLYDLSQGSGNHPTGQQPTICQPAANQQATTNKNGKKGKQGRKREHSLARSPRYSDAVRETVRQFGDAYRERFKTAYGAGAADLKAASAILAMGAEPADVVAVARRAWSAKGFWGKQATSLQRLASKWNEVRAEFVMCSTHSSAAVNGQSVSEAFADEWARDMEQIAREES